LIQLLFDARLIRVDSRFVRLNRANLRDADLSYADLSGSTITEEQLFTCRSLEVATMPDGRKYEVWIKVRGSRGEDADKADPS
jgi:hypothetical protein